MINLSAFDKIYCVHYLPFTERFGNIRNELNRVGIDTESKRFQWKLTFDTPFYFYMFNNPYFKIVRDNKYFFDGNIKCTLAHYEIYKEALGMGYERILVIEDDMVFHKDVKLINDIFTSMPNYDIILFDKWMHNKEKYRSLVNWRKINDYYCEYDDDMLSTGCYAITRKGMQHIVNEQEFFFQPADFWINRQSIGSEEDKCTRAFSVTNVAIQNFSYDKLVNGKKMLFYHDMSFYADIIRLEDYDVRNMQLEKINTNKGQEYGQEGIEDKGGKPENAETDTEGGD
jgi:GR25 family glycosyltransferase involved in LPS biosynthesis